MLNSDSSLLHSNRQPYIAPCFTDGDRLVRIQSIIPEIDRLYKIYAEENHFPGYAYGIVLNDQLIHTANGGFIDLDKRKPVTSESMFRIASITKSFIAMGILILRDEGKLNLDDPIHTYIPELQKQRLTEDSATITVRDLLTQSSGLPFDNAWGDRKLDETNEELITLLKKGVCFSDVTGIYGYSNLAFALLGYLINKITNVSFENFIAEKIWQPLGMKDCAWDFTKISASRLVHGYRWMDENWSEEKLLKAGTFGAAAGIIANIDSFSKYVVLHLSAHPPRNDEEKPPLKRSSLREMHRPWVLRELKPAFKFPDGRECVFTHAYGYGLDWIRDDRGRVFIGHGGGLPGFGSNWYFMPDYGLGVILFANVTYAKAGRLNFYVLDKILEEAKLKSRQLLSPILKDKKNFLIKLLPDWDNAVESKNFAQNFFLDYPIDFLKKQTKELFAKAGKITSLGEVITINQLIGYFVMKGEKHDLQIKFSLSPDNPPLIQKVNIKLI